MRSNIIGHNWVTEGRLLQKKKKCNKNLKFAAFVHFCLFEALTMVDVCKFEKNISFNSII